MMTSAAHLNLINKVDEKTGASVGMWRGVNCAPIEWASTSAERLERRYEDDAHQPARGRGGVMENERYVMTIGNDHNTVQLKDTQSGEIHEFTGARALYDALGVLAEWRERDRSRGETGVIVDGDGDEWIVCDACDDGRYHLTSHEQGHGRGKTLADIRDCYGIRTVR